MNDSRSTSADTTGGEYLSFTLGNEHYGVDILKVQEIRGYDAVTRVPDAPDYIKGVINLRGTIVPVIDLRLQRFNHACSVLVGQRGIDRERAALHRLGLQCRGQGSGSLRVVAHIQ